MLLRHINEGLANDETGQAAARAFVIHGVGERDARRPWIRGASVHDSNGH